MVGSNSRLAKEHPEWLLRTNDGALVTEWKKLGGTRDFEHYVLDTSHPDAMEWIRTVFTTFHSWGARFFKTDFLEWGYRDSTKVKRFAPGKSSAQYFDDLMSAIRGAIGRESYWLGCITYFAPSIGYMDGMRMTSDVEAEWDCAGSTDNDGEGGGIPNMIQESFGTLYMNNIFWQNDPDVTFVRTWHTRLSESETVSLAFWNALLGHAMNTSDELGDLPPDRLALWNWIRPQGSPWTARLPFFAQKHVFRVAVRDYPRANGWAVLFLNEHGDSRLARTMVRQLVARDSVHVYRWSVDRATELGAMSEIVTELGPHCSELLFLSRDGRPPPADLTLGGRSGA
jgi:hypothetical protein